MLRVTNLLEQFPGISINQDADNSIITHITPDSRQVKEGSLFVAFKGASNDGRDYIGDAIEKGAVAVLTTPGVAVSGAIGLFCTDPAVMMGHVANLLHPNKPEYIVAVTGTNGKSSVVHFCRQLWSRLGKKAASIGTVGAFVELLGDVQIFNAGSAVALTTPDSASLHRLLEALKKAGVNHVALEASSHGLVQGRLEAVPVKGAALTNITQDHLDYHQTMDAYAKAKMRLFSDVLQKEDAQVVHEDFEKMLQGDKLTYGESSHANVRFDQWQPSLFGASFRLLHQGKAHLVNTSLIGKFQVENLLCAISLLLKIGESMEDIVPVLEYVSPVEGRMEMVPCGDKLVVLDYAHTPDALENALQALRAHAVGRKVWLVFGCGGDRDASKRPLMGQVASDLADHVIVTDDNPRFEDAQSIRADIIVGAGKKAINVAGRAGAIGYALSQAASGDVVLIAGKGHERYQDIEGVKHNYSDRHAVEDWYDSALA